MDITTIPDDVLIHILTLIPSSSTLATLCTINHRFFALAAPILWRDIVLRPGDPKSRYAVHLEILRQRPHYGALVRTVRMQESDGTPQHDLAGRLIDTADIVAVLERCPRLTSLRLRFTSARLVRAGGAESTSLNFADPAARFPDLVSRKQLEEIDIASSADVGVESLLLSLVALSPNLKRLTWRRYDPTATMSYSVPSELSCHQKYPSETQSIFIPEFGHHFASFSRPAHQVTSTTYSVPFNPPRHIRLPPLDEITESTVMAIVQSCKKLSHLRLRDVVITDPEAIESFALLSHLRSLHLNSQKPWPLVSEASWLQVARACADLAYLALHGPCGVSAGLAVEMFEMVPSLRRFELDGDHVESGFVDTVRGSGGKYGIMCTQMEEGSDWRWMGTMVVERTAI